MPLWTKKFVMGTSALTALVLVSASVVHGLAPASADAKAVPVIFVVQPGEGFRAIISNLRATGLIRSSLATDIFAVLDGSALRLKAGSYSLSPSMSAVQILDDLSTGHGREVTVTIPEGKNLYEIDAILSKAGILRPGELIAWNNTQPVPNGLEGHLFPDTYRFYTNSPVVDVLQKFLDNFNAKAAPLLAADPKNASSDLIMASLVEKEVPDPADQKIVAGVLWKRERAGMPLQVDATLCYAEWVALSKVASSTSLAGRGEMPDCGVLDTKVHSVYNTYLNKGFPPLPIGNPGISAIQAAMNPTPSPYWYYLSDPKTGKTIFAKTLDEQHQNTVKYLVSQ